MHASGPMDPRSGPNPIEPKAVESTGLSNSNRKESGGRFIEGDSSERAEASQKPFTPQEIQAGVKASWAELGSGGAGETGLSETALKAKIDAFWREFRPSMSPADRLGLIKKHAGTLAGDQRIAFLEKVIEAHPGRGRFPSP